MPLINCKFFNGYKPCSLNEECNKKCIYKNIPKTRILIIHLDALGAVLRSTNIIYALKRKFFSSHISWVTEEIATDLLKNNVYLDKIYPLNWEGFLTLKNRKFDLVFCIDKSDKACSILNHIKADFVYGFKTDSYTGKIIPANKEAHYLWQMGLNNNLKFYQNKKTENQLIIEALNLGPYKKDEYIIHLNKQEQLESFKRRKIWKPKKEKIILGINTGCGNKMKNKKLSFKQTANLIEKLQKHKEYSIVLLGGKEDYNFNKKLAQKFNIYQSPTNKGIRDGLVSINACDIIFSGDSLGLHMAIGLKKWAVAWFGPSCSQEIELYGRGEKIITKAKCSPCWLKTCQKNPMCYDLLNFDDILNAINKGKNWLNNIYSSKPPTSEICY